MQSEIKISNNTEICHIDIEGTIGMPEEWQFENDEKSVATYQKFKTKLEEIRQIESPEIVVNIRSSGGDVNDALLIYEALASLEGRTITTRAYGYTASAATIIAQAASEGRREISPNALYLIHNAICSTEGNAELLSTKVDLLRKTDERLSQLYASRTGRPVEEFVELMSQNSGEGRWLSPTEAIEAGLADRTIEKEAKSEIREAATKNIASKILSAIGLAHPKSRPLDVNILHPATESAEASLASSLIANEEGQLAVTATATLPKEDPSVSEIERTANEKAYASDLKRIYRN